MVSKLEVRRIALNLPDVREDENHFGFDVPVGSKRRGFAWAWRERVDPHKARVPNERVLAVRVADLDAKEAMLMADPDVFFTEPHYDGYAAVLVRLDAVSRSQMRGLLAQAHAVTREKKTSKRATAKLATSVKKRATSKLRAGVSGHRELNSREAHSRSKS
jgi:hypothetical protein